MLLCSLFKRKLHWCIAFCPAPPQQLLLPGPLASGKGTRLLDQHIPFWLLRRKKDGGWWVGGMAGRTRQGDFPWYVLVIVLTVLHEVTKTNLSLEFRGVS